MPPHRLKRLDDQLGTAVHDAGGIDALPGDQGGYLIERQIFGLMEADDGAVPAFARAKAEPDRMAGR